MSFVKNIYVDFDGVIHSYKSGWKGADVISDPPVKGAIQWLAKMSKQKGIALSIYSSRNAQNGGIEAMRRWLMNNGLSSSEIANIGFPTEKGSAWLTIDDRCYLFDGLFPDLDYIENFKPWNKT